MGTAGNFLCLGPASRSWVLAVPVTLRNTGTGAAPTVYICRALCSPANHSMDLSFPTSGSATAQAAVPPRSFLIG